jgi:hypothetical protein
MITNVVNFSYFSRLTIWYFFKNSQISNILELLAVNLYEKMVKYGVIQKSLRDFRPLRYSSRDGHAEGEHIKGREFLNSFCVVGAVAHLQVSPLGGSRDET